MKLEVYDDVYQKLVEYVRQMHPPEDSDPPSEKELTTTLNDIVQRYLEKFGVQGGWILYICNKSMVLGT